jgi:hypothetical protein
MPVAPSAGREQSSKFGGLLVHGGWAAAVILAFVVGRSGDGAKVNPDGSPANPGMEQAGNTGAAEPGASRGEDGGPPVGLTDQEVEAVRTAYFDVLEEPNELTRLRKTMEFFESLTAASWQTAFDAMAIETVQTGRTHDMEWRLLLRRGGELMGAAGMEQFVKEGKRYEGSLIMTGWAATDPMAARAWVEALPPGEDRSTFLGDLVDGMVQQDPTDAVELLASLSPSERAAYAGKLIRGTIQHGGYAAATAALEQARQAQADAGETNTSYTNSMFRTIADRVLFSNWTAKTPQLACRWIGENAEAGDLNPTLLKRAAGDFARADPAGAVLWLETLSQRADKSSMLAGVDGIVEQWTTKIPGGVTQWLEATPDHPLYDQVAMVYLQRFQGQMEPGSTLKAVNFGIKKVVEKIKDPVLKQRAQMMIKQAANENEEVIEVLPEIIEP